MVEAPTELRLLFSVVGEADRRRFLNMLVDLQSSGRLEAEIPGYRVKLVRCASPDQALQHVRKNVSSAAPCPMIVISELFAESAHGVLDEDSWMPSSCAKELREELQGHGAVIAIVDRKRRVRDIDRTLSRSATADQMLATIKLVAEKLSYLARPTRRTAQQNVIVRLIRRQHELMEYFRLRYRIYRIMGYLEHQVEEAPSQMEIDWCDRIAMHVGAFEQRRDGQERLVGTARVVIGAALESRSPTSAALENWVVRLAAPDPVLKHAVNRVLELELPIFHSQDLSGIFREATLRGEVCGELSRVIVAEDFRGGGLSSKLVEFAVAESARAGVQRLFLECLELHEPVYRKHGFTRLDGGGGAVLGVNQTMIGMQRFPLVPSMTTAALAVGRETQQASGAPANV